MSWPGRTGQWLVRSVTGDAGFAHGLDVSGDGREVWIVEVSPPAIVVGSTQDLASIDGDGAASAGLDVVRRRSGGGVVLVDASVLWVDVIVPAGDELWRDDVGLASLWLGEVWAEVARRFGLEPEVHRGPMIADDLGRLVCYVGRGPGEVLVGDAKLVGISQRRTRGWARFQCSWLHRWDPDPLIRLVRDLEPSEQDRIRRAGIGAGTVTTDVVGAFLDVLGQ